MFYFLTGKKPYTKRLSENVADTVSENNVVEGNLTTKMQLTGKWMLDIVFMYRNVSRETFLFYYFMRY